VAIKAVDVLQMSRNGVEHGTRVLNGPHFQSWFNVYKPGRRGKMHCHNADETLCVLEGELTVHAPDGTKQVAGPGTVVLITGGSFYELENSGSGKLVFVGHNSKPTETMTSVDYGSRQRRDGAESGRQAPPRFTTILV